MSGLLGWAGRHKIIAAVVVLVVLGGLASLGGGAKKPETAVATERPSPTAGATAEPTSAPTLEVAEAPPTPSPTPAGPTFATITLTGKGDSVPTVSIPAHSAIARITYQGESNFVVKSIDAAGESIDLEVNTIGSYTGTVLLVGEIAAFEVTAAGTWTIAIDPITEARAWDGSTPTEGSGDDVLYVQPPVASGIKTATFAYPGESNFVVWAWTADNRDLLVNEIGPYSGEVRLLAGMIVMEVTAAGPWSVTPS